MDTLPQRSGHFLMESGLHGDSWLELDSLFLDPAALRPMLRQLATLLPTAQASAICGPLLGGAFLAQALAAECGLRFYYSEPAGGEPGAARYRLPDGLLRRAAGERFLLVDDVVSAGSSLLATLDALQTAGAQVLAAGALISGAETGRHRLAGRGLRLHAAYHRNHALWTAADCPLCRQGLPL